MPFPPQFLDELRARLSLSEVIGKVVPIQKAGREYRACCPFHKEKSPSFYINDGKGFFHCFGCGAHGDIIGFTMRHDRLAFPEAIDKLAQQAGLEVPKLTPQEVAVAQKQKTLHQLCEEACLWFENELRTLRGKDAYSYLRDTRALPDETIDRFRLGYAPAAGAALVEHLQKLGFDYPSIEKAGLAKRPDDGRSPYSFFRDRVMFPVTDARGRVVAFGGRIMSGDGPKYINSPDHALFHKGQMLYNFAKARQAVGPAQPFIVVEGYMDVIALSEAGFVGAVAPLGTAFTEAQVELMWKASRSADAPDPILCFDGDNAGQRAAARALDRVLPLVGPGRSVRFAFMQGGKDPDELIKSAGRSAMDAILQQAIPMVDMLFRVEAESQPTQTPEQLAGLKARLDERCAKIADPRVKSEYIRALRDRFDARFGWAARKSSKKPIAGGLARPIIKRLPPSAAVQRQELLLTGILRWPDLFEEIGETLVHMDMRGPLDKLWQAVVSTLSAGPNPNEGLDSTALRRHLESLGFNEILAHLLDDTGRRLEKWTKLGASRDEVHKGVSGILAKARADNVAAELGGPMRQGLASTMTDEQLQRLVATRRELFEARRAAAHQSDEEAGLSDGKTKKD